MPTDWQWLMNFFGPEELAELTAPLTDEQYAMLDRFTAEHTPTAGTELPDRVHVGVTVALGGGR